MLPVYSRVSLLMASPRPARHSWACSQTGHCFSKVCQLETLHDKTKSCRFLDCHLEMKRQGTRRIQYWMFSCGALVLMFHKHLKGAKSPYAPKHPALMYLCKNARHFGCKYAWGKERIRVNSSKTKCRSLSHLGMESHMHDAKASVMMHPMTRTFVGDAPLLAHCESLAF